MNVLDLFRKRRGERREDAKSQYWKLIEEAAREEHTRTRGGRGGLRGVQMKPADPERTAAVAAKIDAMASQLGIGDEAVAQHLLQTVEMLDLAEGNPERQLEELKAKQNAAYAAVEAENAAWAAEVERRQRLGQELNNEVHRLTGEFPECNRRIDRLAELRQLLTQQGAPAALTAGGAL